MARVLTSTELAYQRRDGQRSRLYLAFPSPSTVFTARVNGVPSGGDDQVSQIAYDGGSADFADVCIDQTVLIGSVAGAHDLGIARVRGNGILEGVPLSGVSGTLYLGEISEVVWQDDAYLSILDEFGLWPRHIRITDAGVVYMDYSIAYSDQHAVFDPVPVMGPHAIGWLPKKGTVEIEFDASDSWVLGSSIGAWAWTANGADSISGDTTATPTITYASTGCFRVDLIVTATTGRSFIGRRYVCIYDKDFMPATQFTLDSCQGSFGNRGWSFSVTMLDEADLTEVRDRALVILFARDWYGETETSIGPIISSGSLLRANILAMGWIAGESIDWNPERGIVSFEVQGPQHWLAKMPGFPSGLEDVAISAANWVEMFDLTDRKGLFHFFHYCSTASRVMDLYLYPDTTLAGAALSEGEERQLAVFSAPPSNLLDQAAKTVLASVRAHILCDRYGRMFVQRDLNEIAAVDRSAANAPVVQALSTADWRDTIAIQRMTTARAALLDTSGVGYKDGVAYALFSLAPGHVFKRYGDFQHQEGLALWATTSRQTLTNNLCALIFGKLNNEYPVVTVPLASNHRAFDIAPWQYAQLTVVAGDTKRGIAPGTLDLIPRRLNFRHDPKTGVLLTDVEFEASTFPGTAIDGDPPPELPDPPDPPGPPAPPDPPAPPVLDPDGMLISDRAHVLYTGNFRDASPTWVDVKSSIEGVIWAAKLDPYDGAGAWVLTGTDNLDQNDFGTNVGLWRCDDITSPSWSLVFSQAQGNASSYTRLVCGTGAGEYIAADAWGQMRSMIPCGPGEVYIVEAKGPGAIGERAAGMANASSMFKVGAGGGWALSLDGAWSGQWPGECGATDCHGGLGYASEMYWCTHDGFKGCHQINLHANGDPLVSGSMMRVLSGDYCHHPVPPPCPDQSEYLYVGPLGGKPTGAAYNVDLGGTRHRTRDNAFCVVFDGGGGAQGHLITASGATVANNIYDSWSFLGPTMSGTTLYWCRYKTSEPLGVNEILRGWDSGEALPFDAGDLFGTAAGAHVGVIGYIAALPSGKERLIILRRSKPDPAGNTSVIYWWTEDMDGLPEDKTGNINDIIDGNKWSGTGPLEDPASAWNIYYDNVGASIFGANLP